MILGMMTGTYRRDVYKRQVWQITANMRKRGEKMTEKEKIRIQDVYKRQAVNNAIVLYRLAVERRDVEEAQRVYFVTEKLAPVSYTHLDVYKRQHIYLTNY